MTLKLARVSILFPLLCLCSLTRNLGAADATTNQTPRIDWGSQLRAALPPGRWLAIEGSVDRALAWLATQQSGDGSFPTLESGQPGVTSLCVLAFLSRGHQPGRGPYGAVMDRALDFVLSCQKADGLLLGPQVEPGFNVDQPSHTGMYNHSIAGLMLGEVYGSVGGRRAARIRQTISKALELTRQYQKTIKENPADQGGWRYYRREGPGTPESDLSATGWQLMFLRSARNAEFRVPQACIDDALRFVRRCWDPKEGLFFYCLGGVSHNADSSGRGMMGSGIVALCLGGRHEDPIALAAGDWLLAHPYRSFGDIIYPPRDRFFYSAYYCSQAMAQLGGHYWEEFFPSLAQAMLAGQRDDGSWPAEERRHTDIYGNCYSTALGVLALTPPYQLLPVYQR